MRIFLFLALVFALTGCSSKDEERRAQLQAQCVTADWRGIGYEDGAKGRKASTISRHRRNCAEFGVTPSLDDYLAGHAQGMSYYCEPQNGYVMGTHGHRYTGGCPASQEAAFATASGVGYGLYERQVAVDDASLQLSSSRQRSQDIENLIARKTQAMFKSPAALLKRPMLIMESNQLTNEKGDSDRALPAMEASHATAQRELEDYRQSIDGRYSS